VNNQRHSAADAATGWDSRRCAAVVRIGPVTRGWRSDMGGSGRYLMEEKANFQLNYCHGAEVQYYKQLDETSGKKQETLASNSHFCF
jgi:hypothetical protein